MSEYDITELLLGDDLTAARWEAEQEKNPTRQLTFTVTGLPPADQFVREYKTITGKKKTNIMIVVEFAKRQMNFSLNPTSYKRLAEKWGKDCQAWVGKTGSCMVKEMMNHKYLEAVPYQITGEEVVDSTN